MFLRIKRSTVLDMNYEFKSNEIYTAIKFILLIWLASRIFVFFISYITLRVGLHISNDNVLLMAPDSIRLTIASLFWSSDSGWYESISKVGYIYAETKQSSLAFFPLYPVLWSLLGKWLLVLFTQLSCVMGLLGVYIFARTVFDDRTAQKTILLICFFPSTQALLALRPEALLLTGWVWALLLYKRNPLGSIVFSLIACFAKPNGFLILVILAGICLTMYMADKKSVTFIHILAAFIPLLGPVLFSVYCNELTGDALAWSNAQSGWGAKFLVVPMHQFYALFSSPELIGRWGWDFTLFSWCCFALALYIAYQWLKFDVVIAAFIVIVSLMSFLNFGVWVHSRHIICVFPIFVGVAYFIKNEVCATLLLITFSGLLALYTIFQVLGIHAFSA